MSNAENAPKSIIDVSSPEATAGLMEAAAAAGRGLLSANEPSPAGTVQSEREIGQVLCSPKEPMKVARVLAGGYPEAISYWQGEFWEWTKRHYRPLDTKKVKGYLYRSLEGAVYVAKDAKGDDILKPWAPNRSKVADVLEALAEGVLDRAGDADRVRAMENGVLERNGKTRELKPHSPSVFNLSSLPYAYNPEAAAPAWGKFLDEVLPGEDGKKDQAFLQEWFGYLLTGRTNIHKIAVLAGESRSGKGTILRVMRAIVGEDNAIGGSMDGLVEGFGLQPLIGKSLALFGDVRWANNNVQRFIQRILEISGEDVQTINRKSLPHWTGTLGVRIVFAENGLPRINDPSGAMNNRMHIVRFGQSFAGREDWGLTDRLLEELPGIFNWAMDGLDRLEDNDGFTTSDSTKALKERVGESSDRFGQFCDEYLVQGEGLESLEDDLVAEYEEWKTRTNNKRDSTTAEGLREQILDRFPNVKNNASTRKSMRINGHPRKVRAFLGLGLLHPGATAAENAFSAEEDEEDKKG